MANPQEGRGGVGPIWREGGREFSSPGLRCVCVYRYRQGVDSIDQPYGRSFFN